ncbi:MAG: hypothetical protein GKR89_36870 [Candidatus Latescibacteria bacterium]|nr:hypothetical protein [Candidatus Latescibacterota bacterium]
MDPSRPIILLVALLLATTCASTTLPIAAGISVEAADQSLHIQYLGTGGYLIRRGADVLLTAPFFSNPSLARLAFAKITADTVRIDSILQRLEPLQPARAILVGHAHYDHLMDLPHIAARHATEARIYGSQTAVNTLSAVLPADRLVAVDQNAGTDQTAGTWHYPTADSLCRFMALKADHAPHVALGPIRLKFFKGRILQPLEQLPQRAWGWKEGRTLAYLIDFLRPDGGIQFRLHYQDAASAPPQGFPPLDPRPVDVAIFCVPGAEKIRAYPDSIARRLNPRHAVLGHWEDFFRPWTDNAAELRPVPRTDPRDLIQSLTEAVPHSTWTLPRPGGWLYIEEAD